MPGTSISDEALVAHLRRHPEDEQGWSMLLKRYHRLLWWHLHQAGLASEPDAEDLYQTLQEAVWEALSHNYQGRGLVLAFVNGVLRNQVKRILRAKGRQQEHASQPDGGRMMQTLADPISSAQRRLEVRESPRLVADLLSRLNDRERRLLLLRYLKYSYTEISGMLGFRRETACRRAMSRLLKKIAERCKALDIDPEQFGEGLRTLWEEGMFHEMLER